MQGWAVTVEVASEEPVTSDQLDTIAGELEDLAAAVAGLAPDDPGRWSVTLSVDEEDSPTPAIYLATARVAKAAAAAGLSLSPVVRAEAVTFAEQDAELARAVFPAVVGISEIAHLLGVSRQRASELQHRAGFPAPVVRLKSGPIWLRANLDAFVETWTRKVGRPPVELAGTAGIRVGGSGAITVKQKPKTGIIADAEKRRKVEK